MQTACERTGYLNAFISTQATLFKRWQIVLIGRAERLGNRQLETPKRCWMRSTAELRSSCIIDDADCPPLMITRFVIAFRWFTKKTGLTTLESRKRPRGPSCRYLLAAERNADDSVSAAQALPPLSAALEHWPWPRTLGL